MEAAQTRVQKAVTALTEDLDKSCIRKIELQMYQCQAKCCEDGSTAAEDKIRCVERCSNRMQRIQSFLQNEMQSFESRMSRGAMDCQDRARDKITADTTSAQHDKIRAEMEGCVIKCIDDHIELLKPLFKRIKSSIEKDSY